MDAAYAWLSDDDYNFEGAISSLSLTTNKETI